MKKTIILLVFLLTGCWNYKELSDYSIVTGISVDKQKDKYEVSVLISNAPQSNNSGSSEAKTVVYSGIGDTMYLAIKDIGLISPKELYLGHFSVLVLSEEIAKDGVSNVIDLFLRDSSSKKNFSIVIARECKAKDTLKILTPLTDFPSQSISENLLSTTDLQGIISNISFNDLVDKIERNGIEATINSLYIIGNIDSGSTKENIETSNPKAYIKLGTLGILKDDKLISWTTKEESTGINIINNKIKEMYIKINYNDGYIVFDTTEFKTKINIKLKNNTPMVYINSIGEAKIVEVNCNINLNNQNILKEIQNEMNNEIKKYIIYALNIAIKNKSDIFGFGLRFYQNYPNYYKIASDSWEDNLGSIKYFINSNVSIKSIGYSENSLEALNEKQ